MCKMMMRCENLLCFHVFFFCAPAIAIRTALSLICEARFCYPPLPSFFFKALIRPFPSFLHQHSAELSWKSTFFFQRHFRHIAISVFLCPRAQPFFLFVFPFLSLILGTCSFVFFKVASRLLV